MDSNVLKLLEGNKEFQLIKKQLGEEIDDGYNVSSLQTLPGWNVFWKRIYERKQKLLELLLSNEELPQELNARLLAIEIRKELYKEFDFILTLPKSIVDEGERARIQLDRIGDDIMEHIEIEKANIEDPCRKP